MEATGDKGVTELREEIPDLERTTADLAEEMQNVVLESANDEIDVLPTDEDSTSNMEKDVLESANDEIDALPTDEGSTSKMKDYFVSHVKSEFRRFTEDETPEYVILGDDGHNLVFETLHKIHDSMKEPLDVFLDLNCKKIWSASLKKDDDGFLCCYLQVESPILEPFEAKIRSFLCNADGEELGRWDTECFFTQKEPRHPIFRTKVSDYTTSGDSEDSLSRGDKQDLFVVRGLIVYRCSCCSSLGTRE